jgi:hypothetical protein
MTRTTKATVKAEVTQQLARLGVSASEANISLIAAAPDLLRMCQIALAAWEGTGPPIILDDLRAALAKAHGYLTQRGAHAGAPAEASVMGNRVLIQFAKDTDVSPAIYGHWAGSDAAETIKALRAQMADRPSDLSYVAARCLGRLIGGDESSTGYGLWNAPKHLTAAESHGDAGVFLVDIAEPVWRVTVLDGHVGEHGPLTDSTNVTFAKVPS